MPLVLCAAVASIYREHDGEDQGGRERHPHAGLFVLLGEPVPAVLDVESIGPRGGGGGGGGGVAVCGSVASGGDAVQWGERAGRGSEPKRNE